MYKKHCLLIFSLCWLFTGTACLDIAPAHLSLDPPPGPPEYQSGWLDGCQSGLAAYGNPMYKIVNRLKLDGKMVENEVYYQAWSDAYGYCAAYIMATSTHGLGNRDYLH